MDISLASSSCRLRPSDDFPDDVKLDNNARAAIFRMQLAANPGLFLVHYGSFLSGDQLLAFDALAATDWEVALTLRRLRARLFSMAATTVSDANVVRLPSFPYSTSSVFPTETLVFSSPEIFFSRSVTFGVYVLLSRGIDS